MTDIEECIYDISILLSRLRECPGTYETMLGKDGDNTTYKKILTRKLNACHRLGMVFKSVIPGTRFGKVIFYCLPKKYSIVTIAGRARNKTIYFNDSKKLNKYYIQVEEYHELDGSEWKKHNEKLVFFQGELLKWL